MTYTLRKPIIVAHRANTLKRIRKYIEFRVPAIEIDVIDSSNDVVLQHVREEAPLWFESSHHNSMHVFRRLLFNISAFRPLRLVDVLRVVNGKTNVLIDLKSKEIADKVVDAIKKANFKGEVYVSSKYHCDIRSIKDLMPEVKGLLTLEDQPLNLAEYIRKAKADGISMRVAFVEKSLVDELHKHGYIVATWTVNDVELARQLSAIGVDMIVTDIPEVLMRELQRKTRDIYDSELFMLEDLSYIPGY